MLVNIQLQKNLYLTHIPITEKSIGFYKSSKTVFILSLTKKKMSFILTQCADTGLTVCRFFL